MFRVGAIGCAPMRGRPRTPSPSSTRRPRCMTRTAVRGRRTGGFALHVNPASSERAEAVRVDGARCPSASSGPAPVFRPLVVSGSDAQRPQWLMQRQTASAATGERMTCASTRGQRATRRQQKGPRDPGTQSFCRDDGSQHRWERVAAAWPVHTSQTSQWEGPTKHSLGTAFTMPQRARPPSIPWSRSLGPSRSGQLPQVRTARSR